MDLEAAKRYALRRLEGELSPNLFYHSLAHTRDVVDASERLAIVEGIQGESLDLLLTAAWLHDIGFVKQTVNHEAISARVAGEVLPEIGYTAGQVNIVQNAIMATMLPQTPMTLLERVLDDADLDSLGRDDFLTRGNDLRREFSFLGRNYTDEEWFTSQISFFESHVYFTVAARKLRDEKKRSNIAELKRIAASLTQKK